MEPDESTLSLTDAFVADAYHLRIPSEPGRIAPTVEFLIQRAQQTGVISPSRSMRLMMALHEALTNSIIHGNLGISSALKEQGDEEFIRAVSARMANPDYAGRMVDIQARFSEGAATWVFADEGAGFDVEAALHRLDAEEPDFLRPSGRGLVMIRAFTDEMRYEDRGRRLILRLNKSVTDEKRVQPRWPMGGKIAVTAMQPDGELDPAKRHEAVARNISADGIAFLQSDLAPTGQVMITIPTSGEPINIPAEVRHWQSLGNHIVEVGCRFTTPVPIAPSEPLSSSEPLSAIHRLVSRMADELRPMLERRTALRLPYTERISIEVTGQQAVLGFARDLSRAGVAFFTTTNLPLEVVSVTLPAGDIESAIQVPARVVRCTRLVDGFYDVAAQFSA